MAREADWMVGNLRRIAKRQQAKMPKQARALTPTEQVRRFMSGAEFERVLSGEIAPTKYARYQDVMLRRFGVEV